MATKIIPEDKDIPIEYTQKLILPERIRIESELLDMERKYGGRSFAYIGKCLHYPDNECTRNCGTPCRHPEKVRPSLEAFGFDISKTLSELFNIELLWGGVWNHFVRTSFHWPWWSDCQCVCPGFTNPWNQFKVRIISSIHGIQHLPRKGKELFVFGVKYWGRTEDMGQGSDWKHLCHL